MPFPFNAFYPEDDAPEIDGDDWKLEVSGLVRTARLDAGPAAHAAAGIADHAAYLHRGLERHRPVERRAVPAFLERIGADTRARMSGFKCADRYYSSIDMATALHPQTILALDYGNGAAAAEVRVPDEAAGADQARLQEPEAHRVLFVTNDYPGGWWEDQGYNWFSGS